VAGTHYYKGFRLWFFNQVFDQIQAPRSAKLFFAKKKLFSLIKKPVETILLLLVELKPRFRKKKLFLNRESKKKFFNKI